MKHLKKYFIYALLALLFLLLVFSVMFSLINLNNNKILKNLSINHINISNMTKEDAKTLLSNTIKDKSSHNISFLYNGQLLSSYSFDSINIEYNISEAVNESYNIGRNSNIFKNNFEIFDLYLNKKNININITINQDKLDNIIEDLSSSLPDKLIQSSYYIDNNNLILTSGLAGKVIDKESLTNKIYSYLNDLTNNENLIQISVKEENPSNLDIDKIYSEIHKEVVDAHYESNPLRVYPEIIGISFEKEQAKNALNEKKSEYIIPLQFTYPSVKINDLDIDFFQDTLAIFTTKYNITNTDRANNLELAAEKIDGTVLSPNEVFSYNKTVGARTIEKGYTEAKIYSNGQVVDGVGGGICQISSTLYDTAVIANLEIVERHNHQFITSYLPAGKDATVVYGAKDLKFKNTRSYPIKIVSKVENGIVTCKILGLKEDTEYSVDIETETLSTTEPDTQYEQDSNLEVGKETVKQQGANGAVVNVYKITKLDGKIISKELLSQDTYKALNKIILKNEYHP